MTSAVDAMRGWRQKPSTFVRQVLGATPDDWQAEVLEAVGTDAQRIALKASKGPGKTTLLAWIVWWYLSTRLHPKVVATSVTGDNLKDGLWAELSKWQQYSPFLKAAFSWSAERIVANDHPDTWWASARTWPKGGDTNQQADTLAGIHADAVLFVIDEAGGVPDAVAAAAEGGLANADSAHGREAKFIIAGNPTHLSGPLYRACTSERGLWWVKEISGDPDDPHRAQRVSLQWAKDQIAKYGRESPYVKVNVFGQFPEKSANTLLGPDEVATAMKRTLQRAQWIDCEKILGVDVARFGDDRSVLQLRQGPMAFEPLVYRDMDTMTLAAKVAAYIDETQPDAVFVDQATFGAGVVDRLKQLRYSVMGVDFGGKAPDKRYRNMRASMWWLMSDWVRERGALPPHATDLVPELTAPVYSYDGENRIKLEKKADIKKRTGVSPDLADALALTFAYPVRAKALRQQDGPRMAKTDFNPYRRT